MARVPALDRDNIPENQRAAFDELIQDRGEVPTGGPGSVMLNAPEVAKRPGPGPLLANRDFFGAAHQGIGHDIGGPGK